MSAEFTGYSQPHSPCSFWPVASCRPFCQQINLTRSCPLPCSQDRLDFTYYEHTNMTRFVDIVASALEFIRDYNQEHGYQPSGESARQPRMLQPGREHSFGASPTAVPLLRE